MRKFLLVSATSLLLAAPSMSYAACTITDEKTEQELSKVEGISSGDFGSVRRDVRALRNAATILQRYGKDEACQQVVATMSDLLRNPKASLEMRTKSITGQTGALQEQPTEVPSSNTEQAAASSSQAASEAQPQPPASSQTTSDAQQAAAKNDQAASIEQPAVSATETKTDPQITGSTNPATSTDAVQFNSHNFLEKFLMSPNDCEYGPVLRGRAAETAPWNLAAPVRCSPEFVSIKNGLN